MTLIYIMQINTNSVSIHAFAFQLTKEVNQADPEQSKATDIRWKEGKCLVKALGGGPAGKKRKNMEDQVSEHRKGKWVV